MCTEVPTVNFTLETSCGLQSISNFRSCDEIPVTRTHFQAMIVASALTCAEMRGAPLHERISELCTSLDRTRRLSAFVISRGFWLHCICTTLASSLYFIFWNILFCCLHVQIANPTPTPNVLSRTTQPALPGGRYSPGSS